MGECSNPNKSEYHYASNHTQILPDGTVGSI